MTAIHFRNRQQACSEATEEAMAFAGSREDEPRAEDNHWQNQSLTQR